MENPPLHLPVFGLVPRIAGPQPAGPERGSCGIWALDGDHFARIAEFESGPAIVLVPSEQVVTLTVALPPMAGVRRREALPFAIEDRIAEPLSEVHVALGAEVAAGVYLAGVVRHDLMRQWIDRLDSAGLEFASLVPDALALPVPGAGSWSVNLAGDRAIVRAADGTGFALSRELLEAAWHAAGEPACIAYGDPLSPLLHAAQTGLESEPVEKRLLVPSLDLRQGAYAVPRARINPLWKRVAMVTVLGVLAHGVIAAADTLALGHIAGQRQAEVAALAGSLRPGLTFDHDVSATLADMIPDGDAPPGQFVPLLSTAANALTRLDPRVNWRSINFEGAGRTLTIEFETAEAPDIQRVAQALTRAGLSAQPRSAGPGQTTGSLVVRAP